MRKIFGSVLILSVLSTLMFYSQAMAAGEDTAQLIFSKTAVSKNDIQNYTIQKGDVFSKIIRRIPGVTEKNIPAYYQKTKELNPEIDNLNKLFAGQVIVLPGKNIKDQEVKAATAASSANALSSDNAGSRAYVVKKGDNLIRIVHNELNIKYRTQKTLLLIKSLNPDITDANRIFAGQIIRLPEGQTVVKAVAAIIPPDKEIPTSEKTQILPEKIILEEDTADFSAEEKIIKPEKTAEGKDSIVLPPAARLAVIKHIIMQMKGTMITSGNYYLPVSKTEQLTIDCSRIPVVELDDQTTMFLDLQNRSNVQLKKMISARWNNYHLVKIDAKDDIIVILKKIFKNTKTYEISKSQKPISVGAMPPMDVMVDWIIAKKTTKHSSSANRGLIQGLRLVYENTPVMPRAIVNYAREHSLIITEISPGKGLVAKPEEIYSLPPITVFPSSSAKDFSYALLSYLNIPAEKDADIHAFNIDQDGFNLSIKADIVFMRGDKKFIICSRELPPQFINVLKKSGNEIIFVSNEDAPAITMEKILRTLNFVYTNGYFSFSGPEKQQAPYNLGFNGTKIKTDKDIYVVNFDFNQGLRALMQETWSANIARY